MSTQISPSLVEVVKEQGEVINELIGLLQTLQDHYQTMALRCDNEIKKAEDKKRGFEFIVSLQDQYDILDHTELT